MKQCLLTRGKVCQVAWLPVKFAIQGKYVRLLDVDGWKVEKVYPMRVKEVFLPHGYFAGGVSTRA